MMFTRSCGCTIQPGGICPHTHPSPRPTAVPVRTVDAALADAWATIDAHDRSGKPLTTLNSDAWNELGDRCIADAVQPATDDERYKESVTLAGLCYAMAREVSGGTNTKARP